MKNILQDKRILITGGSSGLGLETAKILSDKGAIVTICSSNKENMQKAIKESNINGVVCDITNPDDIEELINEVQDIDILINNAGVWLEGNLEDNSYSEISRMIDVNVKGTIYTTKAFLPVLKKKSRGIILNVSSTSGVKAKALQSAYVASKFAIQGFTEGLKEDLMNTNISVIGFYPGGMKTEIFTKAGSKRDTTNFMEPKEIAKTVAFILDNSDQMILEHVIITRPKIN